VVVVSDDDWVGRFGVQLMAWMSNRRYSWESDLFCVIVAT
jgi:hypothetical protein